MKNITIADVGIVIMVGSVFVKGPFGWPLWGIGCALFVGALINKYRNG